MIDVHKISRIFLDGGIVDVVNPVVSEVTMLEDECAKMAVLDGFVEANSIGVAVDPKSSLSSARNGVTWYRFCPSKRDTY